MSRLQTEVQAALVKVSMQDVQELDGECAEVRAAVARRDKLAQETGAPGAGWDGGGPVKWREGKHQGRPGQHGATLRWR